MNSAAAERGRDWGVLSVCVFFFLNWEENRVVTSRALALVQ